MPPPVTVARLRPRAGGAGCRALCVLALIVAAVGCGKKGPPLAPLAHVPVSPGDVSIRRAGDEVIVRFTVPRANTTGVQPADIARVDVYAWTGPSVPTADMFKYGTVVASVPVRRPPPPPPPQKEGEPPPPPPPPPTGPGVDQGAVVELRERLAPAAYTPIVLKQQAVAERERTTPLRVTPPDLGPPLPDALVRWYVVVGVNRNGRRGQPAQRAQIALRPAPPSPTGLSAEVRREGVDLAWTAPAGLRAPVQPNALPPRPATPRPTGAAAPGGAPGAASAPRAGGERSGADLQGSEGAAARRGAEGGATAAGVRPGDEDDGPVRPEGQRAPAARATAAGQQAGEREASPPGAAGVEPRATEGGTLPAATVTAPGQQPGEAAAREEGAVPAAGAATEPKLLQAALPFPWPVSRSGFNVYEVPSSATAPQPPSADAPLAPELPKLLTPTPLAVTKFTDPRVEFGAERCYAVRTVETAGTLTVESAFSERACVTPKDVFPPAAPKSLGAVSSAGSIGLIWEASTDADLAGYIVFRSSNPGDALQPLMTEPTRETTYRDASVQPGTRYFYEVVAVDTAGNRSGPSNRVDETAR